MEQSNLQNGKYWETLPREMIEGIIKGNIKTLDRKMTEMTEIFCSAGYYLKRQQNEEQWKETGASNFAEYVKATYGKSRGWATRMIQINDRYSIGGNDPRLDAKYQSFSVSQLQEMLYLTEDEAAGVTPEMTVRQIRQQRPAPEPKAEPEQERQQAEDREWSEIVEEVEAEIAAEEAEDAIDNDLKRDDFDMDCNYRGVTINRSKTETWATVARNMKAIRAARAQQEAEEAAAAARPGYIEYAAEWQSKTGESETAETGEGQQAEVIDLADFCDVATDPEHEPEPEEDTAATGGFTVDMADLTDPEVVLTVKSWENRIVTGTNEIIMEAAAGDIFIRLPEGAAAGAYTWSDVYAFELEARRDLEQYRECNRESAELGQPGLPERVMKKATIKADAARVLLALMEICASRSYDHADE